MGNRNLGDAAQAVINFLVEHELRSAKAISGKRLRAHCRSAGHDVATVESAVVPTYVRHSGTAPDDEYEVTFAGLRASSRSAEVEAACVGVVAFLRDKFASDPDFRAFTSRELAASAPGPTDLTENLHFFRTLIRVTDLAKVAGWGSGNPETYNWAVPPDIEHLIAVQSIEEFEEYLAVRPTSQQTLDPGPRPTAYDVTLSFAGEDRANAEALAHRLTAANVKVFYDRYEQANLWGKDLYEHLHSVYSEQATFCVIFVSRHYATKVWTTHERKAAQERALKERGGEYILPIRVDETRLPGVPDTIGYVGIEDGIDRIAEMLLAKLRARGAGPPPATIASPTGDVHETGEPRRGPGPELALRFVTKSMDRDSSGTVVVHHYELIGRLVNRTKKRLDDWYMEVELPTPLLEPGTIYATLVKERSDARRSVFRTSTKLGPLPSGDPYEWRLPYRMDDKLFWNQREVVEQASAVGRVFVDGALVAETTLDKIQNF